MPTVQNLVAGGRPERIHVKLYGLDVTNTPSQVVDTTSTITATPNTPSLGTIVVDPNDNRAVIVTPLAEGTAFFTLDRAGNPLPGQGRVQFAVAIAPAAPPDNSRIELLSSELI